MKYDIKKRLVDIIRNNNLSYTHILNNGEIGTETKKFCEDRTANDVDDAVLVSFETIMSATTSYARYYNIDFVSMNYLMGPVYNSKDVVDGKVKNGAHSINKLVRFYTMGITSYFEGAKTNEHQYSGPGYQGYVDYDKLVARLKDEGVSFNGPGSFEELESLILNGEKFDISIDIDLKAQLGSGRVLKQ